MRHKVTNDGLETEDCRTIEDIAELKCLGIIQVRVNRLKNVHPIVILVENSIQFQQNAT